MEDEVVEWIIKDKEYKSFRTGGVTQNDVYQHIIWLFDNPNIPKESIIISKSDYLKYKREYILNQII
jgi:hypothetical protein